MWQHILQFITGNDLFHFRLINKMCQMILENDSLIRVCYEYSTYKEISCYADCGMKFNLIHQVRADYKKHLYQFNQVKEKQEHLTFKMLMVGLMATGAVALLSFLGEFLYVHSTRFEKKFDFLSLYGSFLAGLIITLITTSIAFFCIFTPIVSYWNKLETIVHKLDNETDNRMQAIPKRITFFREPLINNRMDSSSHQDMVVLFEKNQVR